MRLLVVDTDRDWVEMLTGWLKSLGYEVRRAYSGAQAEIEWAEQQPDLVILDMALKDVAALSLCQRMKYKHDALVVIMTESEDIHDEVSCLNAGADDYLRKPFYPSQLLARIRAVSRRARTTVVKRPPSVITVGSLNIDALHNEVSLPGKTIRLTPIESKLLHFLAINASNVCTAEQIVTHVWGYNGDGDASLIKGHIRQLRQKLEQDPANPHYILTVPRVGYKLALPVS